jgi:hypothetical protein
MPHSDCSCRSCDNEPCSPHDKPPSSKELPLTNTATCAEQDNTRNTSPHISRRSQDHVQAPDVSNEPSGTPSTAEEVLCASSGESVDSRGRTHLTGVALSPGSVGIDDGISDMRRAQSVPEGVDTTSADKAPEDGAKFEMVTWIVH